MTSVYLGLGANIEPQASLQTGIAELRATFGEVYLSPVYRAPAVGMDGPDFLNMVVAFACPMSHAELVQWIREIETKHGRKRATGLDIKPTSHGLDMDLLLFGQLVDVNANVPRADILTCAYVLQPLADIAPNLVHPAQGLTISQLNTAYHFDQIVWPTEYRF